MLTAQLLEKRLVVGCEMNRDRNATRKLSQQLHDQSRIDRDRLRMRAVNLVRAAEMQADPQSICGPFGRMLCLPERNGMFGEYFKAE